MGLPLAFKVVIFYSRLGGVKPPAPLFVSSRRLSAESSGAFHSKGVQHRQKNKQAHTSRPMGSSRTFMESVLENVHVTVSTCG